MIKNLTLRVFVGIIKNEGIFLYKHKLYGIEQIKTQNKIDKLKRVKIEIQMINKLRTKYFTPTNHMHLIN